LELPHDFWTIDFTSHSLLLTLSLLFRAVVGFYSTGLSLFWTLESAVAAICPGSERQGLYFRLRNIPKVVFSLTPPASSSTSNRHHGASKGRNVDLVDFCDVVCYLSNVNISPLRLYTHLRAWFLTVLSHQDIEVSESRHGQTISSR